jgi:polysaccharide export outer membrane protein
MPARYRYCTILALLALVLAACSSPGSELPLLEPIGARTYTLDTGDTVRIIVFGNEDLSREYAVDGAGVISFPLIGTVNARGLSRTELESELRRRLGENILVDPSVSVQIVSFRPFFILGEVQRPGQFPYVNDMTVLAAVAIAGGYTYRAQKEYVRIIRKVGDKAMDGRTGPDSFIVPGDVIYVYERLF